MTAGLATMELRWILDGAPPPAVEAWFGALGPAPPVEARTDAYLPPTDDALGVKWRPASGASFAERPPSVEAKRRASVGPVIGVGRAEARAETWVKWSLPVGAEAPDGWQPLAKRRRQHRDGGLEAGCALELSTLVVNGQPWWTVALEASAPNAHVRERWLLHAATRWLARPDAPVLAAADAAGYPAWLRRVLG